MRERDSAWEAVLHLLHATETAAGGVLLVEGEAGMGKGLLLSEAIAEATRRGFSLTSGIATELKQMVPLGPLLSTFKELSASQGAADELDPTRSALRAIDELGLKLQERAGSRPVLVCLDDLQYADPTTLLALSMLPRRLSTLRLGWILARRLTVARSTEVDRLFGRLRREGARRVELRPLTDEAVTEVACDVLGADPDSALLKLAAGSGGNPFLVTELLCGLREEGSVQITAGQARLTRARLPQRIRTVVQCLLDGLEPQTCQLLEAVAVLGRSFSAEDAAELLGRAPIDLLPALREAIGAGLLTENHEDLGFRHELVWRAIVEMMPGSVRRAVHRQIAATFLDRGDLTGTAARHLIEGAHHSDAQTLTRLDEAAAQALPHSPQTAVALAERALQLTDRRGPTWLTRTATLVDALSMTGGLDRAAVLVRSTLTEPVPLPTATRLACAKSAILHLQGRPAEAVAEAEGILAERDLSDHLRDEARITLLRGLVDLPDPRTAEEQASVVLARPEGHSDALLASSRIVLAMVRWERADLSSALDLLYETVRQVSVGSVEARRTHPRLVLARLLTDVHRLDEAENILRAAQIEVEDLGHRVREPELAGLRAHVHLAAGRLQDATGEAESALRLTNTLGTHLLTPWILSILGSVALRNGDLRLAARHMEDWQKLQQSGTAYGRAWSTLVAAQVAEAHGGRETAMQMTSRFFTEPEQHRPMIAGPSAVWLVRLALANGDRTRAERIAATATDIAGQNPAFPCVTSAAAHAQGLLRNDPTILYEAAAANPNPWAQASAFEDAAATFQQSSAAPEAVRRFDQALALYDRLGARRDAARVRSRLRRLGVRRRHWSRSPRPRSGWESLTKTECAITELAAQGLTNKQIAEQMFLSAHTVAYHLRHVFRKLDITSRVELARIFVEHDQV